MGAPTEALDRALSLVRWNGFILFLLGATDIGLTWLPLNFGNREWGFATITASFNGMPIILIGLMLVVVACTLDGRRWWGFGAGVVAVGFLLLVVGGTTLWATNVPLALGSVEGIALTGLKKAIFKTSVQSVVLPIAFGIVAYHGFKAFKAG